MILGNWPSFVVASMTYPISYDVLADFEPIAQMPNNPYIVVSKNDLPAKDLKELVALPQGQSRQGLGRHRRRRNRPACQRRLFPEGDRHRASPSCRIAPARPNVMRDLVAGHIDLTFDQAISALPYVRNGQVRAYAITAKSRIASAPDIPTVDEAGAPGVYISTWFGLWAPKGTPAEALGKLTAAAMESLADPAVAKRLTDLGQEIPPAGPADAGRALGAAQGRDGEVGADHQGGGHQGGVAIRNVSLVPYCCTHGEGERSRPVGTSRRLRRAGSAGTHPGARSNAGADPRCRPPHGGELVQRPRVADLVLRDRREGDVLLEERRDARPLGPRQPRTSSS